jgi:hypothetical protein
VSTTSYLQWFWGFHRRYSFIKAAKLKKYFENQIINRIGRSFSNNLWPAVIKEHNNFQTIWILMIGLDGKCAKVLLHWHTCTCFDSDIARWRFVFQSNNFNSCHLWYSKVIIFNFYNVWSVILKLQNITNRPCYLSYKAYVFHLHLRQRHSQVNFTQWFREYNLSNSYQKAEWLCWKLFRYLVIQGVTKTITNKEVYL